MHTFASRGASKTSLAVPKRLRHPSRSAVVMASGNNPTSTSSPLSLPCVQSGYWQWKEFGRVHFRYAGQSGPVILFVPGFGVGAFHFEDNLADLASQGFRVYALDKLGLGKSTVENETVATSVSLRLWRNQITAFIEEILEAQPVFLAGNSLGGLLAASVSSVRTDLVRGALLLNAAPFWVDVPPSAPAFVRSGAQMLLDKFWRNLTDADTVRRTLQLVYAKQDRVTEHMVNEILRPTNERWARDVFRSVLLSPQLEHGFYEAALDAFGDKQIPLALINGTSDPWVGPVWGMRLKSLVPDCTLYELSPCGHCAHSEATHAVDYLVREWVSAVHNERPPPIIGSNDSPAAIGDVSVVTKSEPRTIVERLATVDNLPLTFLLATFATLVEKPFFGSV